MKAFYHLFVVVCSSGNKCVCLCVVLERDKKSEREEEEERDGKRERDYLLTLSSMFVWARLVF